MLIVWMIIWRLALEFTLCVPIVIPYKLIADDFNCHVGSRFYNVFCQLASDNNLIHSDLTRVTGRWVCDDRFYGLVNRSNR